MADLPQINAQQINKMKAIAGSEADGPVFMLNLNCYTAEDSRLAGKPREG